MKVFVLVIASHCLSRPTLGRRRLTRACNPAISRHSRTSRSESSEWEVAWDSHSRPSSTDIPGRHTSLNLRTNWDSVDLAQKENRLAK
jgi:hypothetical protein